MKQGHDAHVVAKITKKIGEWSARETAENIKERAEGNRAPIPAGSERPEVDPEESSDLDIRDRPDKRRRAEKIKKLGGTPMQRREQIRATLLPGYYVCESGKTRMRILLCLLDGPQSGLLLVLSLWNRRSIG